MARGLTPTTADGPASAILVVDEGRGWDGTMDIEVWQRRGNHEVNEDGWGSAGQSAWVLDGATDLFGVADVAAWVSALNEALHSVLATRPLSRINVSRAIERARDGSDLPDVPETMLPHVAMAAVDSSGLCLAIGDCFAVQGGVSLTDRRISPFSEANRRRLEGVDDPHGRREVYQRTRLLANTPEGYPILSPEPSSADRMLAWDHGIDPTRPVVLHTDGMLPGHDGDDATKLLVSFRGTRTLR